MLDERLILFYQPSPTVNSYGDRKCGCSWDSGPIGVYCHRHDYEELFHDAVAELVRGIEQDDSAAVAVALSVVKGLTEDPTPGVDR